MILHKKFGIAFPAKHFKITWKFIFSQFVYYVMYFTLGSVPQYGIDIISIN